MRGKLTILAILSLAVALGLLAWVLGYQRSRRILTVWGGPRAAQIRLSEQVRLARLTRWHAPTSSADSGATGRPANTAILQIDNQSWLRSPWIDISSARGLINARHALVEDASYRWPVPAAATGDWQLVLSFSPRPGSTDRDHCLLALDLTAGRIRLVGTDRTADISPIAEGLRQFTDEQFTDEQFTDEQFTDEQFTDEQFRQDAGQETSLARPAEGRAQQAISRPDRATGPPDSGGRDGPQTR